MRCLSLQNSTIIMKWPAKWWPKILQDFIPQQKHQNKQSRMLSELWKTVKSWRQSSKCSIKKKSSLKWYGVHEVTSARRWNRSSPASLPPQQQKFGMAPWANVLLGIVWLPDGVQDQGGALLEGEPTPRSLTHWLGSQVQTWKQMQEKHLTPFND